MKMEFKSDTFFLSRSKMNNPSTNDQDLPSKMTFKKNKERNNKKETFQDKVKKTFDKKSYRLKKYSKKYKLEQWEEQRKKKLLRDYYKDVKNDSLIGSYLPKTFDDNPNIDTENNIGRYVRHPDLMQDEPDMTPENKQIKKDPFFKAKEQYNKSKIEKEENNIKISKAKEEIKQKLDEYKKKKADRFKKLSRKTKKGQPVMKGRLELLLEKIQQQ